MTETTHSAELSTPLELRVLAGPLQGSRSVKDAARLVHVGGDVGSDVVLPESDLDGSSLAFRSTANGAGVLALSGAVWAAGRALVIGEEIELPLYVPLRLGRTVVALGLPGASAWDDMPPDGPFADPVSEQQAAARDEQAATGAKLPRNSQNWPRWLVMSGGALAAVSVSMLALAYAVVPPAVSAKSQAPQAEAALRAAGFIRLNVQPGNGQELVVSGYLDTLAQRAQVEQLITRQSLPSRLSVWVNQDVAAAVTDVFRVNGVAADVTTSGPGSVMAVTRVADAGRLEQIKTIARRDVPGLQSLEVRNTPPPVVPEPAPVIDDPGKRVTSIVPGDPAYVVTADGTRYFEGALLPTGHRVVAIREREVLLERNGSTAPLRF